MRISQKLILSLVIVCGLAVISDASCPHCQAIVKVSVELNDDNPLWEAPENSSHSASVRATFGAGKQLLLSPSVNIIFSNPGTGGSNTTRTVNLASRCSSLDKKLLVSARVALSMIGQTTSLKPNLRITYKVDNKMRLKGEIQSNVFRNDSGDKPGNTPGKGFEELTARFSIIRQI